VSDRDFAEFTAAASLCMVHIAAYSEELILRMSQNFGLCTGSLHLTGSSIMPQKKKSRAPELARGKTGVWLT
jgi:argininosuccinate lyase